MGGNWALLGGSWPLLADATARHTFEFGRIQTEADWLAPLAVFGLVLLYTVFVYRRDTVELGGLASGVLVSLRMIALAGLLLIYLEPQWRNERDVVHNSRVALLVDTSLSMEAEDNDATAGGATRAQKVTAALGDNKFLRQLQNVHDVLVYRFDRDLERIATLERQPLSATPAETGPIKAGPPSAGANASAPDWQQALAPRGTETRLGQALRHVLNEERGSPLAGIIVITDGQQNAGVEANSIADLAREAAIGIYPVGVGSARQPANVRVRDLVVPARAYPGDPFTVSAYLQSQGLAGRTVEVELFSSDGKSGSKAADLA
ncbi:MAG TPA: VWA domain-containing protein, partial [Pirellulales bacterium]|nr:VWA domain-containing protein [Pirellulales bacterium]